MFTQVLSPPPSIADYISYKIVLEEPHLPHDLVIPFIANSYPGIVFQSTGDREDLLLYGQTVQPIDFYATGRLTIIAYFFYPPLLKAFFGFDAKEWTDRQLDLGLLPSARGLREQISNAPTPEARMQLMDNYIMRLAGTAPHDANNALVYATRRIQKANGLVSLQELQQELCVTERTFQRLFETHVGVTPKMFRKICQFNAAFQQLNQRKFTRLADIAYEHNYADPSHFIRIFREFTRRSPGEYLKGYPDF
jgi:AraC-like DNA-binding protein